MDGEIVDSVGTKTVTPASTTTYELVAVNRDDENETDTAFVTVEVLSPEDINRTFGKPATASTYETCCGDPLLPEFAFDEDMETRWSSAWSDGTGDNPEEPNFDGTPDDEWITVDLEEIIDLEQIILQWEGSYGSSYDIEVSFDGYLWESVYAERQGDGEEDNIVLESPIPARFLRMKGIDRATEYGYSLYEMSAYGTVSAISPPQINLYTTFGNFIQGANNSVTIHAEASSDQSTIAKVTFYVDGEEINTITEAPYSVELELESKFEQKVSAIVRDAEGLQVQSEPLILYQEIGNLDKIEAESDFIETTGEVTVGNNSAASGGKFLDLQDAWTVTFPEFNLWSAGEKLVVIGYQLLYESPKSQYLVANGDTVETIEFTAHDTESWMTYATKVQFDQEYDNQIAIHGFWNWMGVDYIIIQDLNRGLSVEDNEELPTQFTLHQNYPNPFNPSTQITYQLPKTEHIEIKVFDVTGKLIATLVNRNQQAGTHTIQFDAQNLSSGIYFYQLSGNFGIRTNKMMLIK